MANSSKPTPTVAATSQAVRPTSPTEPLRWLEEHGDALLAYALARVGDEALAEDLVQDTLLAGLKAREGFRGQASVRTWLIGILRRRVADYYRRESRRFPAVAETNTCDQSESPHRGRWPKDPADLLEHAEFRRVLDECLAKLPKTIAGVFVLRTMDGVSAKELCNLFDLSTTNLRVRLHRARTSLRDCLEKSWG